MRHANYAHGNQYNKNQANASIHCIVGVILCRMVESRRDEYKFFAVIPIVILDDLYAVYWTNERERDQ